MEPFQLCLMPALPFSSAKLGYIKALLNALLSPCRLFPVWLPGMCSDNTVLFQPESGVHVTEMMTCDWSMITVDVFVLL